MRLSIIAITLLMFLSINGCKSPREKIIGSYDIDSTRGCATCVEQGPEFMLFEDWDLNDNSLGYYRFEYQNGARHSGIYDILQVDTICNLTLYPDSATIEFFGLIGTTLQPDYRITGNKIKENCNGLFNKCVWIKRD